MPKNCFEKVWQSHEVKKLWNGQSQLQIGLHLIHEVTSPQAFGMIRDRGLSVACPERTFATIDHIIPTKNLQLGYEDAMAEEMVKSLEQNCKEYNIKYFGPKSGSQGIVHVIGPELGLTQPGMTVACGDSHTSTHGAFGSIAFGIGTSQVRDVLASQTLALSKPKVRLIDIQGQLGKGVYAKDLILHIIAKLGVNGGIGYAYEYAGASIEALSMEERMTICNMSIEGGARVGYISPDQKTYEYIRGRPYAPKEADWARALEYWNSTATESSASFDDEVHFAASEIEPTVTWGINPGQSSGINGQVPELKDLEGSAKASLEEALSYMKLSPGQNLRGTKIEVAFIGSCTNGRLSDLQEVASQLDNHKVAAGIKALIVPGSMEVKRQAEALGLHEKFLEAGFEWREPGCSMCLAMNPDKLIGDQLCASSSNRNFKGRQGSSTGRTMLMSPLMVAAAAIKGEVADAREVFSL